MTAVDLACRNAPPRGDASSTVRPIDLNGPDLPFDELPQDFVDMPIVGRLREVAALHPSCVAVRDGERAITYRQMISAVDRLSARIRACPEGCGAVGLLVANSALHPVAALACLAAGRAFAPFGMHDPRQRTATLIRDAALDVLLVATGDAGSLADLPDVTRIDIDDCLDAPPAARDPDPGPALPPDHPAAILHTSGSSGHPKAIVVSQASLLQRVLQEVNAAHIGPADQICPLSSPCTISGVREQLSALLTGATLHMVDPRRDGLAEIRRLIAVFGITIVYAVPALLRAIVRAEGQAGDLSSLRVVRVGGDAVPWSDVLLLRSALARTCRIQIGFSSTESPGMQWFVPADFAAEGATVPLGYELPGMRLSVLDEQGSPVRPGEVGELVIRSRFVALGLWKRGACVTGRFPADPDLPNARINASGDLVRLRPDGLYAFAGRRDRQVKIRGQRVDTSEVEAAVRAVPGVSDAVVVATVAAEATSITAFIQPARDTKPERLRLDLRRAMRALPEAMRPTAFRFVDAIPRLPSAKPDVPALLAIARTPSVASSRRPQWRWAAPMSRTERIVASAWRETLGQDAVSRNLTWTESGGDSLRLLRFAFLLRHRIGRHLPLESLDGDMRVRDVAAIVETLMRPAPQMESDAVQPLVFFMPGIEGDTPAVARFRDSLKATARFHTVTYPDWQTMVREGGGFERFVEIACADILALPSTVPLRLAGYSLGGFVALALALRLEERNRRVEWLAIFDTDLEWFTGSRARRAWSRPRLAERLEHVRAAGLTRRLLRQAAKLALAATAQPALRWLASRRGARLPAGVGLPAGLPFPVEYRLDHTMRLDIAADWVRACAPRECGAPITVFRSEAHEEAASNDLGWSGFTHQISVRHVPGNHATMFYPPNSAVLAESFAQSCLDPPPCEMTGDARSA